MNIDNLDLSSMLSSLRHAKDELKRAVVPLWDGVKCVALFTSDNKFEIFNLLNDDIKNSGYFICEYNTEEKSIIPIREAENNEISEYLGRLTKVNVDMANKEFAFIAKLSDKLLGIPEPSPIFFGGLSTNTVNAECRYDGVNLFYERDFRSMPNISEIEDSEMPLFGLLNDFNSAKILSFDNLDVSEEEETTDKSNQEKIIFFNQAIYLDPALITKTRLSAIASSLYGKLECWEETNDGYILEISAYFETKKYAVGSCFSPLTSGVCLAAQEKTDSTKLINFMRESVSICVKQLL